MRARLPKRGKEGRFMTEPTKPEPKPEDLTKTTDTESIELAEEDLTRVSGGAFDAYIKI
jgi:hypothetical protein